MQTKQKGWLTNMWTQYSACDFFFFAQLCWRNLQPSYLWCTKPQRIKKTVGSYHLFWLLCLWAENLTTQSQAHKYLFLTVRSLEVVWILAHTLAGTEPFERAIRGSIRPRFITILYSKPATSWLLPDSSNVLVWNEHRCRQLQTMWDVLRQNNM